MIKQIDERKENEPFADTTYANKEHPRQNILVAYASRYGTTKEVATAIGEALEQQGNSVATKWVNEVHDLSHYDAVIIGSAIQFDKWVPEATGFVKNHRDELSRIPVSYFFTCMTLAHQSEKAEQQAMAYADKLKILDPQVQPITVGQFAGAVNFSKMPLLTRLAFKGFSLISGIKEGDYRNWDAIRSWAKETHFALAAEQTRIVATAEKQLI